MTLLDTNVVIDAQNHKSPFYAWAGGIILGAIAATGAAINAVTLAELCAAERAQAEKVEAEIASAGVHIIDLPVAAAPICGRAYIRYRSARRRSRGGDAPAMPLPDFFIGAHAELMGWKLATRDTERFRLYFPNVELLEP